MSQGKREEMLIKWLKYYENIDNIKYNLSVHYLYYGDCDELKAYKIDPYKIFEKHCTTCNEDYYIEELYNEHKCSVPINKIVLI